MGGDMKNKIETKCNSNYIILHHFFPLKRFAIPLPGLIQKWLLIAESIRRFRRLWFK
jgi:hypothetical protein